MTVVMKLPIKLPYTLGLFLGRNFGEIIHNLMV